MGLSKLDEFIHVGLDGLDPSLHRRDGITLPPETYAAAHHGSEVPEGIVGSSAAMQPTEVRSENEALICL